MPVKSLMEMAAMACIKNIKSLESIGDFLPYDSVRHILLKVDNAYQLRQIELNSPQLQGETGEIWIKIIEKDFPMEYKNNAYKPPAPEKWYRVWEKYKKEHDTALEESEKILKNALAGLKEDKEKNTSKIIERKYLPRAGRVGPKRVLGGPRDTTTSTLTFNLGSRTKTHNGASIMRKVRREVKEIATIHGSLSKPGRGPTGAADVKKAPAAMVGEHRRAAQPRYRTSAQQTSSVVEQYEKRASFISDSEDDDDGRDDDNDDEDDEEDAILGETVKKPGPRPATTPSTKHAPSPATKSAVSEAAKVSLLKKRPGVLRAAPAPRPVAKAQPSDAAAKQAKRDETRAKPAATAKPSTAKQSTAQPSTTKPATAKPAPARGSATLSNKFNRTTATASQPRPSADKASPEPPAAPPSEEPTPQADSCLPAGRTAQAREGSAGPSSPEELIASLAEAPAPAPTRKRKPVDIFMRPKKRAR